MKFVFASVFVAALPSALLAHDPAGTVRVSLSMWLSSARSKPTDCASLATGAARLEFQGLTARTDVAAAHPSPLSIVGGNIMTEQLAQGRNDDGSRQPRSGKRRQFEFPRS